MRAIVIELLDHVSAEEVQEFADEINRVFQPHKDAYVAEVEVLHSNKK